jgi:signal transduction histidine kinase
LKRELTRAQKSEQLKTVFIDNISHTLRSPLNAILGFSNIILEDEHETMPLEQVKETASSIKQNTEELLSFVSKLYELSKFQGITPSFTFIEVNLSELMASYRREALNITKPDVLVRVTTDLSPHCKVWLDTNFMHQLMMHLLRNAAHYTNEGTITINYEYERKGMRVTITDTGEGVPKEYLENAFSLLHMKDSLTLENRATELGLSICKAIIDGLGGEISLTSEPGNGTTSTVWFPCRMRDMTKESINS